MSEVTVADPVASRNVVAQPVRSSSSKNKKKKQAAAASGAGENTGRWTNEEHRLFLQGLEQHGKGWKKIAGLIKSRTVVQIRTHAQKYFQKLAKARQNGEEGDVQMEGRGGVASVASLSTSPAQTTKRRRQTTGTKRKAIQSVVASAIREGKKIKAEDSEVAPLPAIAPILANFVIPGKEGKNTGALSGPSAMVTTIQGTMSGQAYEDSLYRFLTPAPVLPDSSVSDVARQAGANPISVPNDKAANTPGSAGGEISPTGVDELSLYPAWTDAKDPPSWYAKGADVDALLDVGNALDWLVDTGDANETYEAPPDDDDDEPEDEPSAVKAEMDAQLQDVIKDEPLKHHSESVNSLPNVDSSVESVVPPLPSIFESTPEARPKLTGVPTSELRLDDDDKAELFEDASEEHDFVSTILDS